MSLLNQWIRVWFSDDGTLSDISLKVQEDVATVIPFVAAEDFLYIAQDVPFNNFYLEMDTANTATSTVQVQTWANNQWSDVVNTLDGTDVAGATLGRDGVIQFIPDRDDSWTFVSDTTKETDPDFGLTSALTIYDKYWLRVKFDNDLDVGTAIRKLGYAFTTDQALMEIDPEIDNYLGSWGSGKTDWSEQIMLGSRIVAADLKGKGFIENPGQLLRMADGIHDATAFRTLSLIYSKLGPGYDFQRQNALTEYDKLMRAPLTVDKGRDGRADAGELNNTTGGLVR